MYNPGWMRVGLCYGLPLPRVASSHRTAADTTLDGSQDGTTRLQKFESSLLTLLPSHGNTLFKAGWGNTFLYENQAGFSGTFLQTCRAVFPHSLQTSLPVVVHSPQPCCAPSLQPPALTVVQVRLMVGLNELEGLFQAK